MVSSSAASALGERLERPRPARGPRSARRAPGPSTSPGRSASRGCRCRRACASATCPRPGTSPVAASRVSASTWAPRVVGVAGEVLERGRQREELAQAVPAQVVLLDQLLHVLGRRAAGTGLEEAATVHQRDDREHLGRRAELEDREQVGVVVAQHVAGDRDGVLAPADPLERVGAGLGRRHDLDRQPVGVVVARGTSSTLAIRLASWARSSSSQKIAGDAGGPGAGDGELDPVADRRVLGLAGAPDVAGLDRRATISTSPAALTDLDGAGGRHLEGLVVGAVLLGRLGHQADVGHRAHGGRVEGAVGAAVVDDGLVDAGVGGVRDHREGVGLVAVGAPHVPRRADHRGHRGVDDDVGGHVQVGDALVGRRPSPSAGPSARPCCDGGLDRLAVGQRPTASSRAPRPSLGRCRRRPAARRTARRGWGRRPARRGRR